MFVQGFKLSFRIALSKRNVLVSLDREVELQMALSETTTIVILGMLWHLLALSVITDCLICHVLTQWPLM